MITDRDRTEIQTLELRGQPLTIEQVAQVSQRRCATTLTSDQGVRQRLHKSRQLVDEAVANERSLYGVTTGFGGMAKVQVNGADASALQNHLLSFLQAGAGQPIAAEHTRAAMLLRTNMLLQGRSGVRWQIVERLHRFLQADAVPQIREFGSIGASGDLVPLSVVGRAITGQAADDTFVALAGERMSAAEALNRLQLDRLALLPKEGLAIVNGTSFSAAVAANAIAESKKLLGITLATQALMLHALLTAEEPFAPFVHAAKPHPGQIWTATVLRTLLARDAHRQGSGNGAPHADKAPQDRYGQRCLPQYYAPIVEGIARVGRVIEIEMNSTTDNPLIDPDGGHFYQGGNFLGQSIAMAMDDLRGYLALLAKHLDVQIAQLVSPEFSKGLPPSLRDDPDGFSMGLKGLQLTANSIVPLLCHAANPLVQHYPTHAEQYNQNINGLSWGAALLAWNSVLAYRQMCAIGLIFAVQSVQLRRRQVASESSSSGASPTTVPRLQELVDTVSHVLGRDLHNNKLLVTADSGNLEHDIAKLAEDLASHGQLATYWQQLAATIPSLPAN